MLKRLSGQIKAFLTLWLFTALGIFLHELSHHLFGLPSMVSLARNWPLVQVTVENRTTAIIGSLAGPVTNLFLGYIGLLIYSYSTKHWILRKIGFFLGLSNAFLVLNAAVINLIVDLVSGTRGNDLQIVSKLSGINIFILPGIFIIFALIPLRVFWRDYQEITSNRFTFILLVFVAWLLGGMSLMLLDSVLGIRFKII